jgi:tetratricopeptide (TPR) repeat protein
MRETSRTVLAAAARIAEPFDEGFAQVAGGAEEDLQRLVQLSFLRVSAVPPGWQFAHALATQYARALPPPEGLLARLGQWAIAGIAAADARCCAEGPAPLGLALDHATALLAHDGVERILSSVAKALIYHHEGDTIGIRRGRLDFARQAVESVRLWQEQASAQEKATPAWQRESSVVFNQLGDLAVTQGDLAGALRYFNQDLAIAERLSAGDPSNAAWQRDLSVSLNYLGNIAVAQGNVDEAKRYYTENKSIAERLSASAPSNAAWQRDLWMSNGKLGDLATAQGDIPAALRFWTKANDITQRLAASDPANAAWQRDLSVSLDRLGDLAMAQGDLARALRSFSESKSIRERLAAGDPANAAWQRDLSVSLNKLGDLAMAQGDLAGALRSFSQSKSIRERLAASDPANAAWQRDLWVSYWRLAAHCEKSSKPAEAIGWWKKAHDTLAGMKQRGIMLPTDEQYLETLRVKAAVS